MCYSSVTHLLLVCTRLLLVCTRLLLVCTRLLLVCTRLLLVGTRLLFVCHSGVVLDLILYTLGDYATCSGKQPKHVFRRLGNSLDGEAG